MLMAALIGYTAYILASLFLGTRLVLLWRRTREWPELTIGGAFLLGGVLGHVAWLAVAIAGISGAAPETIKSIATLGLTVTVLGSLSSGTGTAMIFRSTELWARGFLTCVALALFAGLAAYVRGPIRGTSMTFWWTLAATSLLYLWGAIEAISVGRILQKRARLGMAEPLVANRTLMWGYSGATVVLTIAISFGARVVYGPVAPAWTAILSSASLLIGAGTIWLGFFPPAAYRTRVERAAEVG
jgi:hypothetical protein